MLSAEPWPETILRGEKMYDTIILGSGAAGIAAARKLFDAGQKILVLEARDRIGGRIWTDCEFTQFPLELGAEFIHGEYAATHEIVRALGYSTVPAPRKENLWFSDEQNTVAKPVNQLNEETRNLVTAVLDAEGNLAKVKLPTCFPGETIVLLVLLIRAASLTKA